MEEIIDRMKTDVNTTVSEIALEMEIIVLEDFQAASTKLDAKVDDILAPTTEILNGYKELLSQLLPDVSLLAAGSDSSSQSLDASVLDSGMDEAVSQAATSKERSRVSSLSSSTSSVLNSHQSRDFSINSRLNLASTDGTKNQDSKDDGSTFSVWKFGTISGSSPITSLLVVVGALFAGVAIAGNNNAENNQGRLAGYESLL